MKSDAKKKRAKWGQNIFPTSICTLTNVLFTAAFILFWNGLPPLHISPEFLIPVLNFKVEQRPRNSFSLNPMVSIAVGLGAAVLIGICAVIIALRVACGRRNRRKNAHNTTTVRVASPGPSIKSIGSKDYEGNDSDEKNPDIIPENIDSDDQVSVTNRDWWVSVFISTINIMN